MDSTAITFDAIIHASTFYALATYATSRLSYTATLPSDATYTVTSTTTSSGIHDTSTLHYDVSQITLLHASTLHVTDPQRLSSPPVPDSSYAKLQTRRGFP